MIGFTLLAAISFIVTCSITLAQFYNVFKGSCYSWSFSNSIFVPENALHTARIVSVSSERSFLECCSRCDVSTGCEGVAFDGEECRTLNGTGGLGALAVNEDHEGAVRVMLYHNVEVEQVILYYYIFQNIKVTMYFINCQTDRSGPMHVL